MKKTLKRIFKILGIVIIVLIAAIILIPILFKGKILEIAQKEANKSLNAIVKFEDLNLSMIRSFPNLSVEIEDLYIAGKDSFATDTLVKFKSLYAGLNLMSVLFGDEIKVKAIILDSPVIKAKVLTSGKANWDIAIPDTVPKEKKEELPDTTKKEESKFNIKLKKFQIKNANIIFDDKSSNLYADVYQFNFLLKGDMTQDFTNLNIKTTIDSLTVESGGIKYLKKAFFGFNSTIAADLKNSKYTFKKNEFQINEVILGLDGTVAMKDSNIVMDSITFKTGKTEFKSVLSLIPTVYMKDFQSIKTSGKFDLKGYVHGTYNSANMPVFGIDLIVENSRFQYPDLPKSVENINIKLKVDAEEGSGKNMTIDLKKAHIEMAKNPVDAKLYAKMTPADINMNGNVKGKVVLSSVKDVVHMDDMNMEGTITANINFKGNLSDIESEQYEKFHANGNLTVEKFELESDDMPTMNISKASMDFSPQFVDLKQFDATSGKSDFKLNGKIYNILSYVFKEELLTGVFNFTSQKIDINEFMGSESETLDEAKTESDETKEEVADSGSEEGIEIPKNLNFTLNSDLKKIYYDKLEIDNTKGKIVVNNGILSLDKLNMNLLDGSLFMSGSLNTNDVDSPKANMSLNITDFSIPKIYKSFVSVQKLATIIENCDGKISAYLSLNSVLGKDLMPVYNTLNSKGKLNSKSVKIVGNRLFTKIADLTKQEKYRNPSLREINLSYTIKDGNLTVEPTKFKIAKSVISLQGTQNLDKTIDFDIGMALPNNAAKNVLSKLPLSNKSDNIDVVAKVGGTSDNPKIVKFGSSLTDDIKEEVKEKIEEVKENVKEKAKEILDKANAQADKIIAEAEKSAAKIRETADKAGKKIIDEAKKNGDKLVKEASNPLAKIAAKKAAQKLVEKAQEKADNLNKKAEKESNELIRKAKERADKITKEASYRADKL